MQSLNTILARLTATVIADTDMERSSILQFALLHQFYTVSKSDAMFAEYFLSFSYAYHHRNCRYTFVKDDLKAAAREVRATFAKRLPMVSHATDAYKVLLDDYVRNGDYVTAAKEALAELKLPSPTTGIIDGKEQARPLMIPTVHGTFQVDRFRPNPDSEGSEQPEDQYRFGFSPVDLKNPRQHINLAPLTSFETALSEMHSILDQCK